MSRRISDNEEPLPPLTIHHVIDHENGSNASSDQQSKEGRIRTIREDGERRVESLRQSVDFICASMRAHGHMQINQLLTSTRHMTMREFCYGNGADMTVYLNEQTQKRQRMDSSALLKKSVKKEQQDTIATQEEISNQKRYKTRSSVLYSQKEHV
ncbi:hypothetical protein BDF14DRAFT_1877230 [Spinellus fusiger]|nr:hypothetical protein BDF14DRAFT_1877230 [Spinellus fusiger]